MIVSNNINNYQITFNARDELIRRAGRMTRLINNTYPRISNTNIEDLAHFKNFEHLNMSLNTKIGDMRSLLKDKTNREKDYLSKIKLFIKFISKYKMGNCDESAKLALLAARLNGIKDGTIVEILSTTKNKEQSITNGTLINVAQPIDSKDLDHLVVYVPNNGKPYVIDPWLGFADFVPNAIQKYKNEFNYHFELSNKPDEAIVFSPYFTYFEDILNSLPQEDLRSTFKELVLPEPAKKESQNNHKNLSLQKPTEKRPSFKFHRIFKTVSDWLKNKFNL